MTNFDSANRSRSIQEALERKILHGLSLEWEMALDWLSSEHRRSMTKPMFRLETMTSRLGSWSPGKREICLNRVFVLNHPWDSVLEVLHHEIAHQFAHQVFGARHEKPHGPAFQKACTLLRANPQASGNYPPLHERIGKETLREEDRILIRIRKLLALAQSRNRHEAEAAMLKAHQLIAKHNIDLLEHRRDRDFVSVFLGAPALRHFREAYTLAGLVQDYYFVEGIWIPAYVLEKGKMGRVLEISGTAQNVQMAAYVHDFVNHFIEREWKSYNRKKGLTRYRKTDFAIGIIEGFRSKLAAEARADEKEPESSALVKMEDPQLIQYMSHRYPHTTSMRRAPLRTNAEVLKDGIQIGKRLVISQGITETGNRGKYLPKAKT